MIFAKSVKQFLRTPVTAALFVILFAAAAFFISSGTVIWARNQATIKAYESVFLTIGTVRQPPSSFELTKEWDAATKTYTYGTRRVWSTIIPPSVLDFDGAGYITGPERRPYYGVYRPELRLAPENTEVTIFAHAVIEFTPLEDCVPDHPVEMRILRVLNDYRKYLYRVDDWEPRTVNDPAVAGQIAWMCDHYNDDPQPLYAGKTYLMFTVLTNHDIMNPYLPMEWVPGNYGDLIDFSTQHRPDGTPVEGDVTPPAISEVTDGFYETEIGRRWLEYARAMPMFYLGILPVLPTNGTILLLPFYNGAVYIKEGEDITPEEYENGERVCLVSENFAEMNGIEIGDTLRLPLFYADYSDAPAHVYAEFGPDWKGNIGMEITPPLNAAGEIYPVFSEHDYVIRGIYKSTMYSSNAEYSMGSNTVIIPMASVRESDADNIITYGPMKDVTTSFRIPNGTIETYMEKWLAQGIEGLEFTFHDHGYTQLNRGLEDMKRVAALFLAVGAAMSAALVFFFCNVFVTKNRMRTAIERMLGYTKKQCAASLLSAFLLAAVIAVAAGCAVGAYAEKRISDNVATQTYYNAAYTVGPLGEKGEGIETVEVSPLYAPAAGLALFAATVLVSALFMRGNVKKEPLKLLSGTDA